MSSDYNAAPVLYRRARAAAARAGATKAGDKSWAANPQAREADDCIIAIVLAHAAIETSWHWEQIQAGVPPHRWFDEFEEALRVVARSSGRSEPPPIDAELKEAALDLFAWRNFLQHGDARARRRLEDRFGAFNPEALTAELAERSVDTCRLLGEYVASACGTQRHFDTNWIDPGEL